LNAPPPADTQQPGTPQANQQAAPTPTATRDIIVSNLIGALGGNAQGSGVTVVAAGTAAGQGTVAGQGTQGGAATAGAVVPGSNGSTSSLVVTIGGVATTITPTVIAGAQGQGSVTAFVVGPGSTVIAGGSALTLAGTTISIPAPRGSGTGGGTGGGRGGSAASKTTTGGVGDAIASGIGYTGPAATGFGSRIGIDMGVCVLGLASGVFGVLAAWL
jgi:hypothetical protein